MKTLKIICLTFLACIGLQSCVTTYAAEQDDVYVETDGVSNVTYTTVVTLGTPYYYNGVISYYLYDGWYYYPYLWNDIWYFRPFHHPRPMGYMYRPGNWHRPNMRLGDMRGEHHMNYGDRSYNHAHSNGGMDMGRGSMRGNQGMQNRGTVGQQGRGQQNQQGAQMQQGRDHQNRGTQMQQNRGTQIQQNRGTQMQQNRGTQIQQNRGTQIQQRGTFDRSSTRSTFRSSTMQRGGMSTPRMSTPSRGTIGGGMSGGGMRGGMSGGGMRGGRGR